MSFLPLGAGVDMRRPTIDEFFKARGISPELRAKVARRRTEIEAGTNAEQRVFNNPDLRGILLGRQELKRTLSPVIRGGKEYTDPKDPGQAGLYKGGLFGQIKDLESQEKSYTEGLEDVTSYFEYMSPDEPTVREVLAHNVKDNALADTLLNSYSQYRPGDFHKNIKAAEKIMNLSLDTEAKNGDEILIDDIDDLVGEHNLVYDIDRDEDYEDIDGLTYRYTTTVTSLYKVSDRSKYDIIRKRTFGPFVHEYVDGEHDYDAEGDDEDYSPENEYFLSLKKVLPKPKGRYYGRPK